MAMLHIGSEQQARVFTANLKEVLKNESKGGVEKSKATDTDNKTEDIDANNLDIEMDGIDGIAEFSVDPDAEHSGNNSDSNSSDSDNDNTISNSKTVNGLSMANAPQAVIIGDKTIALPGEGATQEDFDNFIEQVISTSIETIQDRVYTQQAGMEAWLEMAHASQAPTGDLTPYLQENNAQLANSRGNYNKLLQKTASGESLTPHQQQLNNINIQQFQMYGANVNYPTLQ